MILLIQLFFLCFLGAHDTSGYVSVSRPRPTEILQFQNIPYGEGQGMVLRVFQLDLPGFKDSYNPSLVQTTQDRYTIAFRYDPPWKPGTAKKSKIGLVETNLSFHLVQDPSLIPIPDDHIEDPRLFLYDKKLFMSYTHVRDGYSSCNTSLSDLSRKSSTISCIDLSYKKQRYEKNWTPFVYVNESGVEDLYFAYTLSPFRVLKVKKNLSGALEEQFSAKNWNDSFWKERWGSISGGSQAILVDGKYLCFFHSKFSAWGITWYALGAFLFDGKPPFTPLKVSKTPILFQGIYTSPISKNIYCYPKTNLRVIFPCGLVHAREGHREIIHVTCGENDSAIKIVTFDKEKLFLSMKNCV